MEVCSAAELVIITNHQDLGGIHSIGAPIQVYPLYENAFRAKQGQSMDENTKASSELYAEFARIASQNPTSWTYGKEPATEQTIGTVTKKNRMICFPCKFDNSCSILPDA